MDVPNIDPVLRPADGQAVGAFALGGRDVEPLGPGRGLVRDRRRVVDLDPGEAVHELGRAGPPPRTAAPSLEPGLSINVLAE